MAFFMWVFGSGFFCGVNLGRWYLYATKKKERSSSKARLIDIWSCCFTIYKQLLILYRWMLRRIKYFVIWPGYMIFSYALVTHDSKCQTKCQGVGFLPCPQYYPCIPASAVYSQTMTNLVKSKLPGLKRSVQRRFYTEACVTLFLELNLFISDGRLEKRWK